MTVIIIVVNTFLTCCDNSNNVIFAIFCWTHNIIRTHIRTYVCTCMHVCVYLCLYVRIQNKKYGIISIYMYIEYCGMSNFVVCKVITTSFIILLNFEITFSKSQPLTPLPLIMRLYCSNKKKWNPKISISYVQSYCGSH